MGSKAIKQLEFDKQLDTTQFRSYQKSGDVQLLNQLYSKYMHLIYGVGYNRLHDRKAAQQVVINTYKTILHKAPKTKIDCFKTWLYQTTIEECSKLQEAPDDEVLPINTLGNHILDRYRVMDKRLEDCFQSLSPEEKKCIELFYQKNQCYREISEELRISEKEIHLKIDNAKKIIHQCLH